MSGRVVEPEVLPPHGGEPGGRGPGTPPPGRGFSFLPDLLLRWVLSAFALWVAAGLLSGIRVDGLGSVFLAAAVLGFLNALVRPVLLLLTLPLTIVTLGLFTFVINAFLFGLAASIVPGFTVASFWSALGGSIIVSIVQLLLGSLTQPPRGGSSRTVHFVIRR